MVAISNRVQSSQKTILCLLVQEACAGTVPSMSYKKWGNVCMADIWQFTLYRERVYRLYNNKKNVESSIMSIIIMLREDVLIPTNRYYTK